MSWLLILLFVVALWLLHKRSEFKKAQVAAQTERARRARRKRNEY